MAGYNHVTLVGNLVKDPEVNETEETITVERYAGKEKEPEVDFFNIVSRGKLAEICLTHLKKGKKVLVDGRVQVRSYEVEKQRCWITEIDYRNNS